MRLITFIAILAASFTVSAADIEWEGWSLDYSANDNESGLVLRNVEFQGKKILGRASMPVMRVEYDNDICGPYADILKPSALRPANSGAPNDVCNGQSICQRTYEQDGVKMLEIGSNWQIAEYQIYQTYYFSEEGYFDARVYSRGLQCTVNHRHHAQWMLDFDIDGEANDRVLLSDNDPQFNEFNDLKTNTAFWTIEDTQSNSKVLLTPASDDGTQDNFSRWDVAVRTYRSNEVGRWRNGARGEIGNLFNEGESIDSKDIVFWYISHLPHAASEGSSVWHSSGPRIQVIPGEADPEQPEPQPDPEPEPEPQPEGNNLLANPGFESGLAGWTNCGEEANLDISNNNAHSGTNALSINNGGCLYQEQNATAGEEYALSCEASRGGSNWTIIELAFLDAGYNKLSTDHRQIQSDGNYSSHVIRALAPENTRHALVLFYSEDDTLIDTCALQSNLDPDPVNPDPADPDPAEPDPVNPPVSNLLLSGGFEDGLNGWASCGDIALANLTDDADSGTRALAINGSGCMYQVFAIESGKSYDMTCQAKNNGSGYASVTLAMQNENYQSVATDELAVSGASFSSYQTSLTAPDSSRFGVVTAYGEDVSVFDGCVVSVAQ